ncbi:hypothetical protein [Microbulbifer variabilis]|uniref:hypothetical protein n=1 Tax=Microbulbifer variabilis TaxID=266805 RepID=UPI001CFEB50C|nr:hypothetical protein [Microbulbifer variabilis]
MIKILGFGLLSVASVLSSSVFAASCQNAGYTRVGGTPEGKEYILVGTTNNYHIDGAKFISYSGKVATFSTSEGFSGTDAYGYQDFKWRAKKDIKFNTRGHHFVNVKTPVVISGKSDPIENFCNNVYVQNKPTLSVTSLGGAKVSVSYKIDSNSKFAVEGKPLKITFKYAGREYGGTGSAGEISTTKLSGTVTKILTLPGADDYYISAIITDGTYKASASPGWIEVGGIGRPPCDDCQPF